MPGLVDTTPIASNPSRALRTVLIVYVLLVDVLVSTFQSVVDVLNATTLPASNASTASKFSAKSAAESISNPVARTLPDTRNFSSPNWDASLPIPTTPRDEMVSEPVAALVMLSELVIKLICACRLDAVVPISPKTFANVDVDS